MRKEKQRAPLSCLWRHTRPPMPDANAFNSFIIKTPICKMMLIPNCKSKTFQRGAGL